MDTLKKQSIAHALRENFKAYSEDYPINDGRPSDDAIDTFVNWVENEFENDDDPDKGSIKEWFKIAIDNYLSFFDDCFKPETEMGENRKYVIDQVNYTKK